MANAATLGVHHMMCTIPGGIRVEFIAPGGAA